MATGSEIDAAVATFAKEYAVEHNVDPPTKMSDTINPSFAKLSQADFQNTWRDFHKDMMAAGIDTDIGLQEFKGCTTWRILSNTAFDEQPI